MIAIIDYGVGNLYNLKNALDFQGLDNAIVDDPARISTASHIILPGVGAFRPAMDRFHDSGMEDVVRERIAAGCPFLGICVGMELMFDQSEEDGLHGGLGLIGGRVIRFSHDLKIPQIGWNQVAAQRPDPLLAGIPDGSYFYFVHSYHFAASDPDHVAAETDFGGAVTAMVAKENMVGTQFHPEKSQKLGLMLIANFLRWRP